MPDIAMCHGEDDRRICPLRESCYRHTAPREYFWQAWLLPPIPDDGEQCEYYWPEQKASE